MLRNLVVLACVLSTGCSLLPEMSRQPTVHNPFPQLSKVAVAPFFNLSNEPTVNGREVALGYYNELQLVPGFEVVPVNVVERTMLENRIELRGPADARRLAQLLQVDAVVVGAVTDFTPWYPPRCGLQVEWYAANPGFHPIPPGYGLPWGTTAEEDIPGPLVFEAEMALAKAQLKTQTPAYQPLPQVEVTPASHQQPVAESAQAEQRAAVGELPLDSSLAVAAGPVPGAAREAPPGFPPNWPDPRGFVPSPPRCHPPSCWPSDAPVLRHTRTYNGHDADFTEALKNYYYFRDDARFGGWQSYIQRSDDLIRFCCHMHIWEMLTARGGAGETRVVWRWPTIR